MHQLVTLLAGLSALAHAVPARIAARLRAGGRAPDRGAAVTEYTLVILVAATVALTLLNWVNGGAIAGFFDTVFDQVTGMFSA